MEELVLAKGGRSTIRLEGRGSAGYRWSFTIDNPQIVSVERVVVAPTPNPQHPGGYSLDEKFEIIAESPGRTVVLFTQSRPFEQAKPPIARKEIHVRVNGS